MSAETFTPEPDWSKVSIGDRVRMTTDSSAITGEVTDFGYSFMNDAAVSHLFVKDQDLTETVRCGFGTWELSVRAKPAYSAPIEPGAYFNNVGQLFVLSRKGHWWDFSGTGRMNNEAGHSRRYWPYTRLEPAADTARKVLDWVANEIDTNDGSWMDDIRAARREFGVIDD